MPGPHCSRSGTTSTTTSTFYKWANRNQRDFIWPRHGYNRQPAIPTQKQPERFRTNARRNRRQRQLAAQNMLAHRSKNILWHDCVCCDDAANAAAAAAAAVAAAACILDACHDLISLEACNSNSSSTNNNDISYIGNQCMIFLFALTT